LKLARPASGSDGWYCSIHPQGWVPIETGAGSGCHSVAPA